MTAPQDTWYARLLFAEGRGYPLWDPAPHDQAPEGLRIGEIGWVDNGEFIVLPSVKLEMNGNLPRAYHVRQGSSVELTPLPSLNSDDLRNKLHQYPPRATISYTTQNRVMFGTSGRMDLSSGVLAPVQGGWNIGRYST
ncbi:hypothetical protein D9758_012515 [Tetrapyrgos nigripes]|uniref:Uncharacterized protein n=1 Tax=Tetrapyrgos nigripes TaxID=182062 RepID=A0A8H5G377_9AGAR|nr:hypothetical protein D9758_012515 [Tetrapyrgos nigripes]